MMTLNVEKKFKRQISGEIECFMQSNMHKSCSHWETRVCGILEEVNVSQNG